MKLQYLGDYRDAFKWDLLHWLCSEAEPPFAELRFVPLLTPNDPVQTDGRIHHTRFVARPFIQEFVAELRGHSNGVTAVAQLGGLRPDQAFKVGIHAPDRLVARGPSRALYWEGLQPERLEDTILFLDPDNGFETKTQHGPKWVLHEEVDSLINRLPESAGLVVYQHWPHRAWSLVFTALAARVTYATNVAAVHDATLAFVIICRSPFTFRRLSTAAKKYAASHARVRYVALKPGGA